MNCCYCGTSLGLTALAAGDSDFCTSQHRQLFHNRLRKALGILALEDGAPRPVGPMIAFVPYDVPGRHSQARPIECPERIVLPVAAFAISQDPPEFAEAPVSDAAPAPADQLTTLDRLSRLGSRVRDLRDQLNRVANVRERLGAT
jgi:hypothetical protein